MTRTASHNSVLSLGSCIYRRADRAVETHRGTTFQPVSFGARQQGLVDRLPGLGAKGADRLVQH
jgi:hypothetical protein